MVQVVAIVGEVEVDVFQIRFFAQGYRAPVIRVVLKAGGVAIKG